MKLSIVTPTFNEERNILNLLQSVSNMFDRLGYEYEHIIVDNCSTDNTVSIALAFATTAKNRIRIISNPQNYGPDYSPMKGFKEAEGDLVIPVVADFQDPPEIIETMLEIYQKSQNIDAVLCVFDTEKDKGIRGYLSTVFYKVIKFISLYEEREHFQGFGLYTRKLVDRMISDPYRYYYFRGLISKHAISVETLRYARPKRIQGKTSYNWTKLAKHAVVAVNSQNRYFFDLLLATALLLLLGVNLESMVLMAISLLKNIYTTE